MKLEQHFYTSGKPEFVTVAITDGITREERIRLEGRSIYFLPIALHYQEHVVTPVKYVWYPLSERLFAVGRAIYAGKDSLGRTGNYLFHHYVISRDDLQTACQGNPASLIKYLRRHGLFRDEAPSGAIQPITLADDVCVVPTDGPHPPAREVLQRVLHACLEAGSLRQPLLLLGTGDECLDFLERIYTVLPYEARLSLQVDTYAYGVSLGFPIIGSVDDEAFRQGLTASCAVRLSTLEVTVYDEFPAPSPYVIMVLDMIVAGNMRALHAVFALEALLAEQRFADFAPEFDQASPEIRRILWDFHGSQLLNYIAANQDAALLRMVRPLLKVEHLDTLYRAPELIERLIDDHDPAALALVARWLCAPGSKELVYPALFASEPLWTAWLDMVQARPDAATALTNPLKALGQHYSVTLERILLEHLLRLLPTLRENRKLGRECADILAGLPPQSAVMTERERAYLDVLRVFFRYAAGHASDLLNDLLTGDLPALATAQRAIVLETLVDDILVLRALKMWNPDKAAQKLRALLAKSAQDATFACDVLAALTTRELSNDARKVVAQALADLPPALMHGEHGPRMRQLSARLSESPPSALSKLARRLFGQ